MGDYCFKIVVFRYIFHALSSIFSDAGEKRGKRFSAQLCSSAAMLLMLRLTDSSDCEAFVVDKSRAGWLLRCVESSIQNEKNTCARNSHFGSSLLVL